MHIFLFIFCYLLNLYEVYKTPPTVMYRKVDVLCLVCTVSALVHMLSVTVVTLPFLQ